MKKRPEESVHVRLENSVSNRKAILQTTIDTMQLIKRYENLGSIRKEKEIQFAEFKRVMNSINRMIREVRLKELPLDVEELKQIKKLKTQSVMSPVIKKVLVAPKISQAKEKEVKKKISPFDAELNALQRKLQSL